MSFRKHIPTTIHLFDSLVKPILTYTSDFWCCLKLPKNNPIENIHISFYKDLLGIQRQTPNLGVLLELSRIPLNISAKRISHRTGNESPYNVHLVLLRL